MQAHVSAARPWRHGLVASLVVLGVAVAVPSRAAADDPAGADPMVVQPRLIAAADRIAASTAGTSGLAGITVEADLAQVRIYWKGELPGPVSDVIDRERREVDVEVLPARHSRQELDAAGAEILPSDGVTGVAAQPDGNALLVLFSGDERGARSLPAIAAAAVPILISAYERPILASGRQNDTTPYSGGSIYQTPLGYCSTGFAVQVASVNKIISAGHCGQDDDAVYVGSGSAPPYMGTISGTDLGHDTLLIEAASAGAVYYGPHTSTSTKPVQHALGSHPNTMVCTSGAVTGQHCEIRITHTNITIKVAASGGGWYPISGVVRAQRTMQGVAAGVGDSGGPVVAMDSIVEGFALVYPLGTVTAIDDSTTVPCGSAQFPWTVCSSRVYYADLTAALARYGATIVT
jgi:hypothetical protein